ncbi:MAG: hypothetical protein HYY49_14795 [Ignavibacteriales bacterium]|nr:hypothetical protein [Ignavibacteriales bacterium]
MIDTMLFAVAGIWVLIWAVILVIMVFQKFSGKEASSESAMPKPNPTLHRLQRHILWAFTVSFVVRMLAGFMGWAPPFPPS